MLKEIVAAFRTGQYLIYDHAVEQLFDRILELDEVVVALTDDQPEIIEDREDEDETRCLILCRTVTMEPLHVVCSEPPWPWFITVYRPDPAKWSPDFRRRR